MISLSTLNNDMRPRKAKKIVGRGIGSGLGKTSGRGGKGASARSGYKRRYGNEGGNLPIYKKLPTRGFAHGRFKKPKLDVINLRQIDQIFSDGDEVTIDTLIECSFIGPNSYGLKVLGDGELTKKVTIIADQFSDTAKAKLDRAGIAYTLAEAAEQNAPNTED